MTKSAVIRLPLMLIFAISGAIDSLGQQPTVVRQTPPATPPSQAGANPNAQVQQPQPGMLPNQDPQGARFIRTMPSRGQLAFGRGNLRLESVLSR